MGVLSSLIGGVWGYVAAAGLSAVVAASSAGYVAYKIELSKVQAIELRDAKNITVSLELQAAAMQDIADRRHTEDQIALQAAQDEAAAQPKIVERTHEVATDIPVFISPAAIQRACVPLGLVRVLDAAIGGGTDGPGKAGDLPEPPGQSDDACAPVAADLLAERLVAVVGTAEQNAEQLNRLEAWATKAIGEFNAKAVYPSVPGGPGAR